MEQATRVLVADDEHAWRDRLKRQLVEIGYEVVTTGGSEVLQQFARHPIDLVILELHLRGMDGIETCWELRRRSIVPVVLISEYRTADAIVEALEYGADDFLAKPVPTWELAVRLQAILRRCRQKEHARLYAIGDVTLDPVLHEVTVGGKPVALRPKEYELLHYLMDHAGQPQSKERLSEAIWEYELLDSNVVETAVRRLRRKIEPDPAHPKRLITIRGTGYQLVQPGSPLPSRVG
jgi:DNA-binding response OmpR family regulator